MEFNKPVISIITLAYNCKNTIAETYDSIETQTFSHCEWIIIEDHSTDDSFDFIKNLVSNDSKAVLFQTTKNSWAAVARNVGVNAAKGRFIAFMDADDLWLENKLEEQMDFMIANDYGLTYTDYYLLYKIKI